MYQNCYYAGISNKNAFVATSVGDIYVEQIGQGSPVVFIHGNLGSHYDLTLSPLSKLLSEAHTVYALDRYGAGNSRRVNREHVTLVEHADIIAEVIHELAIEQPVILGHSYGGAVALMFALRHPEKASALVLISPAAHDWKGKGVSEYRLLTAPVIGPLVMETVFVSLVRALAPRALRAVFDPHKPPWPYIKQVRRMIAAPDHFLASARDMQVVRPGLRYIAANYSRIDLPTIVLAGGRDTITPYWNHASRLKEELPHVSVFLLPDAGHQIHFSHPGRVYEAVLTAAQR